MTRVSESLIVYHYGDSWQEPLASYLDDAGNPLSLADYTVELSVKSSFDALTYLLVLDESDGLDVDEDAGTIAADASYTRMLSESLAPGGRYVYDLQITNSSLGIRATIRRGAFWVDYDVSAN